MELFIYLIIHIPRSPGNIASPKWLQHKHSVFLNFMPLLLLFLLKLLTGVHFVFSRGYFGLTVLLANRYNSSFRILPNYYSLLLPDSPPPPPSPLLSFPPPPSSSIISWLPTVVSLQLHLTCHFHLFLKPSTKFNFFYSFLNFLLENKYYQSPSHFT